MDAFSIGTIARLMFEYGGKWAGLVFVAYYAFSKLLDRRDAERKEMMTAFATQNSALMEEQRAYRNMWEQQVNQAEVRNASAFNRLSLNLTESTRAMLAIEKRVEAGIAKQEAHSVETDRRLRDIKTDVDTIRDGVNRIEGGNA